MDEVSSWDFEILTDIQLACVPITGFSLAASMQKVNQDMMTCSSNRQHPTLFAWHS